MPSYATGDLSLFFALARTQAETITSPPSGYVLLADGIGANAHMAIYAKKCTASESAPTVGFSGTGRHLAVMLVLNSTTGWPTITVAADIVATSAEATGSSTTMTAEGITPTESLCCVLAVCGKNSLTNDVVSVVTPDGYEDGAFIAHNSASAGHMLAAWFQEQAVAAAIASASGAVLATDDSGRKDRITLALRPAATTFAVTDVAGGASIYHGMGVVITGTGFGATQGASTVVVRTADGSPTATQTVTSWSDTEISLTLDSTVLPFGSVDVRVTVGGTTITTAATLVSAGGYANGVANVPWPGGSYSVFDSASAAVADGDLYEYQTTTNQGTAVTVLADGTFVINAETMLHEIYVRAYDQTDETWSAWTTFEAEAPTGGAGSGSFSPCFFRRRKRRRA